MSEPQSVKGRTCLSCSTPIPCICGKNVTDPEAPRLLLGRIEVVKEALNEPKIGEMRIAPSEEIKAEPVAPPVEKVTPETSDEVLDQTVKAIAEEKTEAEKIADYHEEAKTFSVIPEPAPVVGNPDPVPSLDDAKITVTVNGSPVAEEIAEKSTYPVLCADVEATVDDKMTGYVYFRGRTKDGTFIELRMTQDSATEFVRKMLPSEEQKIQELLDKIHKIRESRGLFVEEIDKGLSQVSKDADKDFKACQNKVDISKTDAAFRAKLAVLTQKRYLAKFSIQEESELSLLLAKLRHSDIE